jgi:hypothetical protein
MRSRLIAGCALAALVVGVQATGAAAAKPVLWLNNFGSERIPVGDEAMVGMGFGGPCVTEQEATVASNGKPSDALSVAPTVIVSQCESEKVAGKITGLVMKPAAAGNNMTTTVKDSFHVLLTATWCVYTLPKTISLPAVAQSTFQAVTVTGALDKRASYGATCSSSRMVNLELSVDEKSSGEGYWAEVVG